MLLHSDLTSVKLSIKDCSDDVISRLCSKATPQIVNNETRHDTWLYWNVDSLSYIQITLILMSRLKHKLHKPDESLSILPSKWSNPTNCTSTRWHHQFKSWCAYSQFRETVVKMQYKFCLMAEIPFTASNLSICPWHRPLAQTGWLIQDLFMK